jgi:hypothetical protein
MNDLILQNLDASKARLTVEGLILSTETKSTDADALSTTIPISILDHDSDEAVTLADGSTVGQIKVIVSSTANTVTCTPVTLAGASTTIATTEIGSTYVLVWTADGWNVISRGGGGNAAANAVLTLPVLA